MSVTIPAEAIAALEKTNPICLATADKNGKTNLVYVRFLKLLNKTTLVAADNKFDKTRANLDSNPVASVVVLDPDTHKAYQLKGSTICHTEGETYTQVVDWVHEQVPHMTPKAAVTIAVEEVYCGAEKLA